MCSEQLVGDIGALDEGASPEVSLFFSDEGSPRDAGEESRSFDSVMGELASITARQAELVALAREGYAGEGSLSKVSDLEAQLASLQAELASSKAEQLSSQAKLERAESSAQRAADEKLSLMAELREERALADKQRANSLWALKYLQQNRTKHFESLDTFRDKVQVSMQKLEEKIAKVSLEFDEELYPHLLQSVAEHR